MVKVKHLAWILTAILEERVESPQKRGPLSMALYVLPNYPEHEHES